MFEYILIFVGGLFVSLITPPAIIVWIILGYKLYKNYNSENRELIDKHVKILLAVLVAIMVLGAFWSTYTFEPVRATMAN